MQPHFRCIVAMVFIFTSAISAPTRDGVEDACVSVQSSSSRFNKIAKSLSVETRKGIPNRTPFTTTIPWMENNDKCDPGSLAKNPTPCIQKMSAVLRTYHSEVNKASKLQGCSNFTKQMTQALHDFYTDMRKCVAATRGLLLPELPAHQTEDHEDWDEDVQCNYLMERLFSFSILTARVFAVGDPAKHSHGPAAQCM